MIEISMSRIKRNAAILGVAGGITAAFVRSVPEAAAFVAGAALAMASLESWTRIADSLNPQSNRPRPSLGGSSALLLLRYALIAAAIYATVKVLGVSPIAVLLGLMLSFVAVLVELVQQVSRKH
jgi:hypothetical protein